MVGPNQKDLTYLSDGITPRFKITSPVASSSNLYGELDLSGLDIGRYRLQIKNVSGKVSNAASFQLKYHPLPVISSLSPAQIDRRNRFGTSVSITLYGSNLNAQLDFVVFDGDTTQLLPIASVTDRSATFTLDLLTKIKASREYSVYIRHYLDQSKTQFQDTPPLKLKVDDPSCAINNCANLTGEACDTSVNVCRPTCTMTTICQQLDAKASWSCQGGFCK